MSSKSEKSPTSLNDTASTVGRRDPALVMRLERLGSFHQSRLSFMRVFTRRLQQEQWAFHCQEFSVDARGVGHAVYTLTGPERAYSLIAYSHDLPDELRSDRVIAEAWDATFTLFDGVPDNHDIERLAQQVPRQEAGRLSGKELTLSRANRSVRLWKHVVESLANGRQPDTDELRSVGYLMRTTAVYGSGKFGAADRQLIATRSEFAEPFQAEMLSVYLIRVFVRDLVQHMAKHEAKRLGKAKPAILDDVLARSLGIGNSTGLGMAPFLINHPRLFNNWIMAREEALTRVLNLEACTQASWQLFVSLLEATQRSFAHWHSEHPVQREKIIGIREDLVKLRRYIETLDSGRPRPWLHLNQWANKVLHVEAQECLVSLLLEPYPELVDGLACCMSDVDDPGPVVDASMTIGEVKTLIESNYDWALSTDWNSPESIARAWYVSAEKLEPRLGERHEEPIEPYEQPLAPGRDIANLYQTLDGIDGIDDRMLLAEFLLQHPEYRQALSRVQLLRSAPYSEIRDNTIGAELIPFDMLRCKLSFFGATHFDPRSDRWLRICLFANAPYPDELMELDADRWVYPDDDSR